MIKPPRLRRVISIALMILGGLVMFLAPHNAWFGLLFLGAGLALEIVSFDVSHDGKSDTK